MARRIDDIGDVEFLARFEGLFDDAVSDEVFQPYTVECLAFARLYKFVANYSVRLTLCFHFHAAADFIRLTCAI